MKTKFNRRNFIKTSAATLALPSFEAFSKTTKQENKTKLVYLGFIYGVTKDNYWFPKKLGRDFELTSGLEPLKQHKNDLTIFGNISNPKAKDSHFSCTTLLTSADLRRTPGRAFHNNISCDQVAAKHLGRNTRFNSIEIGGPEGGAGPGLSLAWDQAGKPLPGFNDPVELFNQLFGNDKVSSNERRYQLQQKKSILDGMLSETESLKRTISKQDQQKLEEYQQTIRQIELKLSRMENWLDVPKPKAPLKSPTSNLRGEELIKVNYDLIVAALQTDSTHVASYLQPIQNLLRDLNFKYNSHQLSHHRIEEDSSREASMRRDQKHTELLAYFIDKMKNTTYSQGQSLFDTSIITFASGVRHGHMLKDIPVILTGGGRGKLKAAGYLKLNEGENKLSNLHLTTLKMANVPVKSFADSNSLINEVIL
ncbi:MAG: DUF1552 domain-containing protein [Lentisphaeraceae bacterium]|nr:DUF1552 domain-containing protein [Lentisphaeraceae bacterium]